MRIIFVLFLWSFSLLSLVQANKFSPGHTALSFYYAFKADFLSLPAGQKTKLCPGLVSSRGADKLPYFEEFLYYITKPQFREGANFRGLGQTTNPPLSWGYKELAPGYSESFNAKGVGRFNFGKFVPGMAERLVAEGKHFKDPPFPEVMKSVSNIIQDVRLRPGKPGVDRPQVVGESRKAGEAAAEGRFRDFQIWKIKNFNSHYEAKGWTAATSKKKLLDGTEIDVFDLSKTYEQASSDPGERWAMYMWDYFYGTDSSLMEKKSLKISKSHSAALQSQINFNRVTGLHPYCRYH